MMTSSSRQPLLASSSAAAPGNASNASSWSPSHLDDSNSNGAAGVELEFKDLSYTLNKGHSDRSKEKVILNSVTGVIPPAKVTAIFGPTGAGKSTLLDCLTRRKRAAWVSGGIYVNGAPQIGSFRRLSGYVVQDDLLLGSMTVRENIVFSAKLRLPSTLYTPADRERLVDTVIEELKLGKCQNTLVGNEMVRGISGGEKKRCNIACEVVMRPSVLALDEPTTGLDAATAIQVIETIRSLASRGCTVLLSIHQPRYSIFKHFDKIILLSEGAIIYQGHPNNVVKHFEAAGYFCEANNNPADFMFDVLSGLVDRNDGGGMLAGGGGGVSAASGANEIVSLDDASYMVNSHGAATASASAEGLLGKASAKSAQAHKVLLDLYTSSEDCRRAAARVDEAVATAMRTSSSTSKSAAVSTAAAVQVNAQFGVSLVQQFLYISQRYALGIRRMPIILIAQIVTMIIFAGIVGGIYWQSKLSFQGLQNRVGAMFFSVMSMIFSNLGALEIMIKERSLFLHQKANGYFSTGPYFLSSVLCDLVPMRIFPMFLFGMIAYPCMGFQSDWGCFWWFQVTMISVAICSGALCYCISSFIGIFAISNLVVSVIYVIFMLFGGLLVNLDTLPGFLHPIQYLSLFKLGYANLAITELHGLKFEIAPFVHITGDEYLKQQGFHLHDRPTNLVLLWSQTAVYLLLGYFALSRLRKE